MSGSFAITRISNACVLLELGEHTILTDPWFRAHWFFTEPPALLPSQLPKLSAIVGSHSVMDHWNIDALAQYPYKDSTPVFVATQSMVRKAKRAGFSLVEELSWGEQRTIGAALLLEAVPAQRVTGLKVNNYLFTLGERRVFFGGETRDLAPLREYRRKNQGASIYIGPINGMRLLGLPLVTDAKEVLEAAQIMGATQMIPIHYAHKRLGFLAWPVSSETELTRLASAQNTLNIHCLPPGQRWVAKD